MSAQRTSAPPPTPTSDRATIGDGWHLTAAHLRAGAVAVVLTTLGVLMHRPDALVIAAPFLAIAAWATLTRPSADVELDERLADATLREGEATTWRWSCDAVEGVDDVVVALPRHPFLETRPEHGVVVCTADASGDAVMRGVVEIRPTRWGRRPLGPATAVATSSWGAFRRKLPTAPHRMIVLPMPSVFDTSAPMQRSNGLVGVDRSARPGDGSEFAGIRSFQVGDRLRRIHWPVSLRTGTLHVTSTWADQDSHVVLVVDAFDDVGISGGIDGDASSLDVTVRATAAIAEHFLARGDRVSMRVMGTRAVTNLAPRSGQSHLRRVLDALAAIEPGTDRNELTDMRQAAVPAGALTIMLSPLVSRAALQRAATLARNGVTVVVVDTLPPTVADDPDPLTAVAWRIRLLERRRETRVIQEVGVPLVAWRGPGSLDVVLRDIARRAGAPRLVRR